MYIFLNEIMWNFYRTNIDSGTCWIKLCDRDIYYARSIFPIYVCIYIYMFVYVYLYAYIYEYFLRIVYNIIYNMRAESDIISES